MELVKECFPTGKFRKVDTPFKTESTYEKEIMSETPLKGNSLSKEWIEYNEKIDTLLDGYRNFYYD